jgi:hypothetical protein
MSEPDNERRGAEIEAKDDEEKETFLADPDDYHQTQRLRTIHERRRRVHQVIDEMRRWAKSDEHELQLRHLADAVASYITEVEAVLDGADVTVDLPDDFPFDSPEEYVNKMGMVTHSGGKEIAHYNHSILLFRRVNRAFSEVKPLIEEDDQNEWEV